MPVHGTPGGYPAAATAFPQRGGRGARAQILRWNSFEELLRVPEAYSKAPRAGWGHRDAASGTLAPD